MAAPSDPVIARRSPSACRRRHRTLGTFSGKKNGHSSGAVQRVVILTLVEVEAKEDVLPGHRFCWFIVIGAIGDGYVARHWLGREEEDGCRSAKAQAPRQRTTYHLLIHVYTHD